MADARECLPGDRYAVVIDIRLDWEIAQQQLGRLDSPRQSALRARQSASLAATTRQGRGRGQTALRGFLRRVATDPPISYIQAATELEFLRRLQAADSPWPVDTGFSKANFAFLNDGDTARLTNPAPYVPRVEERTGILGKLLVDSRITDAAQDTLDDYARRYRP